MPLALYGDRLNVFLHNDAHWTLAEELRGTQDPTHFGRMLHALGIGFIPAGSPQAKGRVERLWQTLPDRLVSELRLRRLTTREEANAFLPAFRADYNRRFARAAGAAAAGLAAAAPRAGRAARLPLSPPGRGGQHRPARATLGAVTAGSAPPPSMATNTRSSQPCRRSTWRPSSSIHTATLKPNPGALVSLRTYGVPGSKSRQTGPSDARPAQVAEE